MLNMRTLSQRSVRTVAPKRAAVSSRRSLRVEAKRNEVSVSYAKALVELADEKSKLEPVHAGTFPSIRFTFSISLMLIEPQACLQCAIIVNAIIMYSFICLLLCLSLQRRCNMKHLGLSGWCRTTNQFSRVVVCVPQTSFHLPTASMPADMDVVAALIKDNKKLTELIYNPVVANEKKREVLLMIGKEAGFQDYTNNFLNLLLQKDRLDLLEEICDSFEEQYCKLTDTEVSAASIYWVL